MNDSKIDLPTSVPSTEVGRSELLNHIAHDVRNDSCVLRHGTFSHKPDSLVERVSNRTFVVGQRLVQSIKPR